MSRLQNIKDHVANKPDILFGLDDVQFLLAFIEILEDQVKDLESQAAALKEFNKGATIMAKLLIQEAKGDQ